MDEKQKKDDFLGSQENISISELSEQLRRKIREGTNVGSSQKTGKKKVVGDVEVFGNVDGDSVKKGGGFGGKVENSNTLLDSKYQNTSFSDLGKVNNGEAENSMGQKGEVHSSDGVVQEVGNSNSQEVGQKSIQKRLFGASNLSTYFGWVGVFLVFLGIILGIYYYLQGGIFEKFIDSDKTDKSYVIVPHVNILKTLYSRLQITSQIGPYEAEVSTWDGIEYTHKYVDGLYEYHIHEYPDDSDLAGVQFIVEDEIPVLLENSKNYNVSDLDIEVFDHIGNVFTPIPFSQEIRFNEDWGMFYTDRLIEEGEQENVVLRFYAEFEDCLTKKLEELDICISDTGGVSRWNFSKNRIRYYEDLEGGNSNLSVAFKIMESDLALEDSKVYFVLYSALKSLADRNHEAFVYLGGVEESSEYIYRMAYSNREVEVLGDVQIDQVIREVSGEVFKIDNSDDGIWRKFDADVYGDIFEKVSTEDIFNTPIFKATIGNVEDGGTLYKDFINQGFDISNIGGIFPTSTNQDYNVENIDTYIRRVYSNSEECLNFDNKISGCEDRIYENWFFDEHSTLLLYSYTSLDTNKVVKFNTWDGVKAIIEPDLGKVEEPQVSNATPPVVATSVPTPPVVSTSVSTSPVISTEVQMSPTSTVVVSQSPVEDFGIDYTFQKIDELGDVKLRVLVDGLSVSFLSEIPSNDTLLTVADIEVDIEGGFVNVIFEEDVNIQQEEVPVGYSIVGNISNLESGNYSLRVVRLGEEVIVRSFRVN